ncbi:MAG: cytochrome P450 [candidate division KSB1 bacterium]
MPSYILPPALKAQRPFGHLMGLRRNLLDYLQRVADSCGELGYFKAGPFHTYLLNNPEHIKDLLVTHHKNFTKSRGLQLAKRILGEGLLTSEGDFHLRQRRLVQPAFHRQRLEGYGAVMCEEAARMSAAWQAGAEVDMAEEMMRLTLGIVGKTLFGVNVENEAEEIGAALTTAMSLFSRLTNPLATFLEKLPLPSNIRFFRAKRRLDETIYRIIATRRQSNEDRGDLLSMLLLAQDEEGDGGRMTDLQVRDEAMTLFLAGHETTAIALTWTWYLLSQNPEAEIKLREELQNVLGERLPTVHDFPQLTYARMVLAESMRLYPPAYVFGRMAINEYQIGPYHVPAGATLLVSPYILHRLEHFYPEPLRFMPERWRGGAEAERHKFAYIPFGGGPRVCIGEGFAWMESVLVLATMAQRWKLRLVPNHPVELKPLITLRPKFGMKMKLERRKLLACL